MFGLDGFASWDGMRCDLLKLCRCDLPRKFTDNEQMDGRKRIDEFEMNSGAGRINTISKANCRAAS